MTIKIYKEQGMAIKQISRKTGLARNTVKKYIHAEGSPCYQARPSRPSKLDPYKAYIQERIDAARPDWIPASVLYREIQAQGYTGKDRLLRLYLAKYKSAVPHDPIVRFETEPGQQMQVDFTIIHRGPDALKAFVATLGNSRASYVYFYNHERTEAWIDGLKRSFDYFGGVPKEVLFDNAKTIMIERDAYDKGHHRWNPKLAALAEDYGFMPRVCRPYRAKTKGKVERFNRYLKESFIVPLKATLRAAGLQLDVPTANAYIGPWLSDVANNRIHGTTGKIPNQLLHLEQAAFLPLPVSRGNQTIHTSIVLNHGPTPIESMQHPLSVYDQYMEASHVSTI